MPEHNRLDSEPAQFETKQTDLDQRLPESVEPPKKPKQVTRRSFISTAAKAAFGAAVIGWPKNTVDNDTEDIKKYEVDQFSESMEKEQIQLQQDIEQGLAEQHKYQLLLTPYNKLMDKSNTYDSGLDTYRDLQEEAHRIKLKMNKFEVHRGDLTYGPMAKANVYAEALVKDHWALKNLALARVLYRHGTKKNLKYWHDCAMAYLDLAGLTEEQIGTKFGALFKYAASNHINIAEIPQEQILYSLIDPDFDFDLQATALETELNKKFPKWKEYPATGNDRYSYAHYNDLSVLNVFELNRLKSVMRQLEDRAFRAQVFGARDEDLKDPSTEVGGIIPRPDQGNYFEAIPPWKNVGNRAYMMPDEQLIKAFRSAAAFHFHATQVDEPLGNQGPSVIDQAFFAPWIVFSSVDEHTILAHFYVSRIQGHSNAEVKNEVVCLGEITK